MRRCDLQSRVSSRVVGDVAKLDHRTISLQRFIVWVARLLESQFETSSTAAGYTYPIPTYSQI
jgi:hypothetical protein